MNLGTHFDNILSSLFTNPRSETKHLEYYAQTRTRTGDIQIFSLTLSQLSYLGESGPDAIRTHDLRHVKATS